MSTYFSYCHFHIGDNLAHLHYLRKQAIKYPEHKFVHAVNFEYLSQLIEVVCDLSNIALIDIAYKPHQAVDAWKNRDGFIDLHPRQKDYAQVYLDFFREYSEGIGLETPFVSRSDLLFDYPAILKKRFQPFDFLVVNSVPLSLQFVGFQSSDFDLLVGALLANGHSVVTTAPTIYPQVPSAYNNRLSISAIGGLSLACKYVLGICNGPTWPTFNIWNVNSVQSRILLLDTEEVHIAPNTGHAQSMARMMEMLKQMGLL